jgi:hypothetical protein
MMLTLDRAAPTRPDDVEQYVRMTRERPWLRAIGVLGLGYAVVASFTRRFTWEADVVTAVPLAVAVLVTVRSSRRPGRRSGAEGPGRVATEDAATWRRRGGLWAAPLLAVVGWELYCLVNLPRTAHPTLSSLIDMLDGTRVGKTVAFASWLALGWFLVTV